MNKHGWEIKKQSRYLLRKVIKILRGLFFRTTITNLKYATYSKLPVPLHWEKIAGGRKLFVEIGSGHGEVLLANNSEKSISIGYEIKSRFFRLTQRKISRRGDIFVYKGSGYESLFLHYLNSSIDRIFVLFPDPWHKRKHNKRRPLTAEFFLNVAQKLKSGGEIIIATDWPEYADFIKEEVAKISSCYQVTVKPYEPVEFALPITHYHQKWVRKGRSFTAFILKKLG